MLSGGLVKQFQQNGQGDKVESWVGSAANKPVAPHELEQGLGEERLTPQGWLPTEPEAHGMWSNAR
jgi:uncharacterized protein YidB (DUF937 family)